MYAHILCFTSVLPGNLPNFFWQEHTRSTSYHHASICYLEHICCMHVLICLSIISCVAGITLFNQLGSKMSLHLARQAFTSFVVLIVCLRLFPGVRYAEPHDSTMLLDCVARLVFISFVVVHWRTVPQWFSQTSVYVNSLGSHHFFSEDIALPTDALSLATLVLKCAIKHLVNDPGFTQLCMQMFSFTHSNLLLCRQLELFYSVWRQIWNKHFVHSSFWISKVSMWCWLSSLF